MMGKIDESMDLDLDVGALARAATAHVARAAREREASFPPSFRLSGSADEPFDIEKYYQNLRCSCG